MFNESIREGCVELFCEKIAEKLKKFSASPEATQALKEIGLESLTILASAPEGTLEYYKKLFTKGELNHETTRSLCRNL